MSLSIGIVGLPNVGKSTLFNALLKRQAALAANYPFATIEPNVGIVDVPDARLAKLAEIIQNEYGRKAGDREVPEKIVPAVVKFYDIAGLVKGASQGEGLGNQFLTHIRETDAIVHVVRSFEDADVIRAGSTSPEEDISTINTELILADLQVLDKRYQKLEQDTKRSKTPESVRKLELYSQIKDQLDKGNFPSTMTDDDLLLVKDLNLLTLKPVIIVYNVAENDAKLQDGGGDKIWLSAQVESELSSFSPEEQLAYLSDLGIIESGLDKVIKKGYDILGLQTFLTAGPKEVRAWTVKKGSKAPQAAGVIHTDFERGFISAEVVSYENLVAVGSWKQAKEKGLIRIEGKNYVMHDGDVVEFRFSV